MRRWVLFVVVAIAAFTVVGLVAQTFPGMSTWRMLAGLFIVACGLGAHVLSRRARQQMREAPVSGVEADLAFRAGSSAFVFGLVLAAALGLVFVLRHEYVAAAGFYGLLVALVVAYWLTYARLRRQSR